MKANPATSSINEQIKLLKDNSQLLYESTPFVPEALTSLAMTAQNDKKFEERSLDVRSCIRPVSVPEPARALSQHNLQARSCLCH